jgi:hypothetical protein
MQAMSVNSMRSSILVVGNLAVSTSISATASGVEAAADEHEPEEEPKEAGHFVGIIGLVIIPYKGRGLQGGVSTR